MSGEHRLTEGSTLLELAEFWVAILRAEGKKAPQSLDVYANTVKYIVAPKLGHLRLDEIEVSDIDLGLLSIRKKRIDHQLDQPLLAIWGGPHRLGLYRPNGALALDGERLAAWFGRQQWQPADPRVQAALEQLVRA